MRLPIPVTRLLTFAMLLAFGTVPARGQCAAPGEIATRFLHAFEAKDFPTLRGLFAPEAVATTLDLARNGPPTAGYVTAEEWLRTTAQQVANVEFESLTILETSVQTVDRGATVSAHFRATGKAAGKPFTAEGIDTYSLACQGGGWRIVRYGTFELLDLAAAARPAGAAPKP